MLISVRHEVIFTLCDYNCMICTMNKENSVFWGNPAKTAQTMAHSENIQSRPLQTLKKVADFQDNWILSRQLQTIKTVSECQDTYRLSRLLGLLQTIGQV